MTLHLPDDPKPWKVLSSEYISRKFWYTVRVERVELPNGHVIPEYWVQEYVPWVNVVAVATHGQGLLPPPYRHRIRHAPHAIPARTTDPRATALAAAAARRPLAE